MSDVSAYPTGMHRRRLGGGKVGLRDVSAYRTGMHRHRLRKGKGGLSDVSTCLTGGHRRQFRSSVLPKIASRSWWGSLSGGTTRYVGTWLMSEGWGRCR